MTDWMALAKARGVAMTDEELERMAAVLSALEQSFAPLVETIPLATEPAPVFRAGTTLDK